MRRALQLAPEWPADRCPRPWHDRDWRVHSQRGLHRRGLERRLGNGGSKWFIPTENEWYKAAYYDSVAEHYWNYATGTNSRPTSAPPGGTPNTANYHDSSAGFAVTGSTNYDPNQNYLTDVGAYTASPSPYGTFDQSGLVSEWNEAIIGNILGEFRDLRGGSWIHYEFFVPATGRDFIQRPTVGDDSLGFRVANVPEPSTAAPRRRSLWLDVVAAVAIGCVNSSAASLTLLYCVDAPTPANGCVCVLCRAGGGVCGVVGAELLAV